jgi:hypothetical protein
MRDRVLLRNKSSLVRAANSASKSECGTIGNQTRYDYEIHFVSCLRFNLNAIYIDFKSASVFTQMKKLIYYK